jgi:uncharacterized protein (DUF849 family)
MANKIIISCAITGSIHTPTMSEALPVTPDQIATQAVDAAKAGAAIVHIHVREPGSGKPSMELGYYREVVERICANNSQLILNITTGPGGRFVPSPDEPRIAATGTTLMVPEKRVEHIAVLRPEICTIDLNTMNSGKEVVINTPGNVRRMAKVMRDAGVKPEIELFDSGDIALMHDLLKDGTLEAPALCSLVMGVRYGFQPGPETVLYARNLLPADAEFTAIGIGKAAFTAVAQSYLAGGHVRVGLEDAVYLSRGQLASSNAVLVEKARRIVEDLGGQIAMPQEAREIIGLPTRLADASRVA